MAKDPSKYDKMTGQRKISYRTGALAGAAAGGAAGGAWKKSIKGAVIGAGAGALYGLAKVKGRNDSNKRNKRFAAAGYMVGKRAERARLVKALESAKARTNNTELGKTASEKTASDYMRTKQSKSARFSKSMSRGKYASKGFGGSTRRKKI